jgi:small subunit ribosomal protein S1
VDENYRVGQVVTAVVTNVVDFGAFAEVEDGLEGLIHISEISEERIAHPSDVLKVGDRLRVRIIRIDGAERRLGLSMRQVPQQSDQESEGPAPSSGWDVGAGYLY